MRALLWAYRKIAAITDECRVEVHCAHFVSAFAVEQSVLYQNMEIIREFEQNLNLSGSLQYGKPWITTISTAGTGLLATS